MIQNNTIQAGIGRQQEEKKSWQETTNEGLWEGR
jgi:hypothetical protein